MLFANILIIASSDLKLEKLKLVIFFKEISGGTDIYHYYLKWNIKKHRLRDYSSFIKGILLYILYIDVNKPNWKKNIIEFWDGIYL